MMTDHIQNVVVLLEASELSDQVLEQYMIVLNRMNDCDQSDRINLINRIMDKIDKMKNNDYLWFIKSVRMMIN